MKSDRKNAPRRPRLRRTGLTLIEITLAVAILAIMATLTWGSIARSFDAYETVTQIDDRYHGVRVAMNRMCKELSMAFLTSKLRERGPERIWETAFRAEDSTPFFEVHFTSFSHQILRADAKESDQSEISYFGAPDPDIARQTNLVRREDPRIDQDPDEGGREDILAEDIKDFSLRFFDPRNQEWTEAWDTEDPEFVGRLPSVVELSLTVEDPGGEEIRFVTKTRINLTRELGVI